MSSNGVSVVLVHGAWADGSSWSKIVHPLVADGIRTVAAPLPLTSFQGDVAALERTLGRVPGSVVLVGHAYAGAVIAATRNEQVRGLVYIAAFAQNATAKELAEQDRMIVKDNQRFMAERMRAQVRSRAVDHAPMLTAPNLVLDVLGEAIAAVRSGVSRVTPISSSDSH